MPADKPTAITSVLQETRVFKPAREFSRTAHIPSLAHYRKLYNQSVRAPDKFWAAQAKRELVWFKTWTRVLQWNEPFAKWFVGGRLNVSYNCLDQWLGTPRANKKGKFKFRYRFEATRHTTTYKFRARLRAESAYPYELGYSKIVRVRVRGR